MTKKNKKGFTLTELIVVIAIIAILAAILIPTSISFINKAKFSSDVQDAANMTRLLKASCLASDVDTSKLSASDVRTIVNSSEKNYTFIPKSKNAVYWYNQSTGTITVTKSIDENPISAAGSYDPDCIEEVFLDIVYLNVKGELAQALHNLRNTSSSNIEINNSYEGIDISNIKDKFNKHETLFINSIGGYVDESDTNKAIKNIVFSDGLTIIPNMSLLYQKLAFIGKEFDQQVELVIPASVKLISQGAFEDAGLLSTPVKFTVTKNAVDKIQVIENSFNSITIANNSICKATLTRADYLNKITIGNNLLKINVKKIDGSEILITTTNGNGFIDIDVISATEMMVLDCTKNINKYEYNKDEYKNFSINTIDLMAHYNNLNKINLQSYSKGGYNYTTILAGNDNEIVVNITLKTWSK